MITAKIVKDNNFDEINSIQLGVAIHKTIFELGTLGESKAKEIITQKHIIDTGTLRNQTLFYPQKQMILVGVDYGRKQEFGDKNQKARPFIAPTKKYLTQIAPSIAKKHLKNK